MDTSIWSTVVDTLIIPIIVAIATAVILVAKSCFDRISKSIVAKNEIATIESQQVLRQKIVSMIDDAVKAAVAANMSLAQDLKKDHDKLTEDDINMLNGNAIRLAKSTLPPELTDPDSQLYSIIGGEDKIDPIINSLMEKYVYEYNLLKEQEVEIL